MNKRKMRMNVNAGLTLKEGCDRYLDNCKQRNLREHTIKHYRQSYLKLFSYFPEDMPLDEFNEDTYKGYVLFLRGTLNNDISINAYLRDCITTVHFLQREGLVENFTMKAIKTDKRPVEVYSDEELAILLKKPNLKQCSFIEYEAWVVSNFLLSTGVRQRSMINIRVKDIDFDQKTINLIHTKNRKPLLIPINNSMFLILQEFLKYRKPKDDNDWLFCNSFGEQLSKQASYRLIYDYNKRRGIERTGLHRYRHTFAKNWILSGGSVVTLSRLLGHSSLDITQNYLNLLISDLAKEVEEIDILGKYKERKHIKMK